jgi:peroxiredoxin
MIWSAGYVSASSKSAIGFFTRLAVMAASFLLVAGCGSASGGARQAGDFSVQGTDGKVHHLADYRGKIVLVMFFVTYDQRSRAVLDQLSELHTRLASRDLVILGVAIDGPETTAQVKHIARTRNLAVPIALDADTSIIEHYNPKGIVPYGVFFGRDGNVIDRWLGHDRNDVKALEQRIVTHLYPKSRGD